MRDQIKSFAAISFTFLSLACGGGGSPTSPTTAAAPPPAPATLTMTVRAGAVPRSSALDVQRGDAEQARDFMLEVVLGAPTGAVQVQDVNCAGTLNGAPLFGDPFAFSSPIAVGSGATHPLSAPIVFIVPSPAPSSPIVIDCEGRGTSAGGPVTARAQASTPLSATAGVPSGCPNDATTACLANQFTVRVKFASADGRSGDGKVASLTADTGYFWFFDQRDWEVVVRVLNGCSVNSHYWVFAGGLTDVRTEIAVTDTKSGITRKYTNPLNTEAKEQRDQLAIPCPTAPQ